MTTLHPSRVLTEAAISISKWWDPEASGPAVEILLEAARAVSDAVRLSDRAEQHITDLVDVLSEMRHQPPSGRDRQLLRARTLLAGIRIEQALAAVVI